ncbi:kinase-like protein [Rhizophagus irregularis]|uniref:Kinase-like protein n=1 Tax=Rhizophagus irregularis TaxID=588596 RepID=A0A2N0R5Q3_9GLOM|nr:kinase-like protein [Rhizophagus irregularis]
MSVIRKELAHAAISRSLITRATLYCEFCVQNYLKTNFSNWTSGNVNIDNLIQKCQSETLMPSMIVEWIPYNNLQNVRYLTKGGFSEIYTADWVDGKYEEWDSKKQQLKRFGRHNVILKKLENVESANQSWFEEAKSHLTISNKRSDIVQCFGLTQNISNGNYMLVMYKMDISLKEFLQQNHNKLTWRQKLNISFEIVRALYFIHKENAIHRDLHSGNILYSQINSKWYIGDLGFCGPADKSSKSVYGILPYIAPEVINGREYTFKSDIYKNVESANQSWFEEAKSHLTISNKESDIVQCYGLTQNISNGNYMLVMYKMDMSLKEFLQQQNHNKLTWKQKIHITFEYDLGFCGPADKSSESIAPEVINGRKCTFKSDIYSIAMLMWEISSEQPPFNNHEHDCDLALNIINGIRPKIVLGTPVVYKNLMKECWDAGPSKRPDTYTLLKKIQEMNLHYQSITDESSFQSEIYSNVELDKTNSSTNSRLFTSKIHKFENLPEPRNATTEELEVYNNPNFHSEEQDEFEIPKDLLPSLITTIFCQSF